MTGSDLNQLVRSVATTLKVPGAAGDALEFLRRCGVTDEQRFGLAHSDVSTGFAPIEFSFTQASDAVLRILVEPCLPGEGILARTALGIAAVGDVTAAMFNHELARQAQDLVRHLLPQGSDIGASVWRSSVWLALRTTGAHSTVRVYVNAQFGRAANRWRRIEAALSACGLREAQEALLHLRESAADLVQPIGICFDLTASGLKPARIHCVTEKTSAFWAMQLLVVTHNQAALDDATDFLDIFGLLDSRGECPLLVSLGLGAYEGNSLKLDVDLPNLQPNAEARRRARYLPQVEARFGEIGSYRAVRHIFNGAEPRYIGMSIEAASCVVNAYFPGPSSSHARLPLQPDVAAEMGAAFVRAELARGGERLLMDARSTEKAREIPFGWWDVYMTSLLLQESPPLLRLEEDLRDRVRQRVRAAGVGMAWRYLPDLPPDVDDTCMAWASLGLTDPSTNRELAERLAAMVNEDGGFPTFVGPACQRSHPAVTLNLAFAMERAGMSWSTGRTDEYLAAWLREPAFPSCEWIGSQMFPIFLFARATALVDRLGAWANQRLATRIMDFRRADGSWGLGLPDSLETALAVISLDLLGVSVGDRPSALRCILDLQFADGGWGWSPLFSDGDGTWFGQRAITTAFAVRAVEILAMNDLAAEELKWRVLS
jgi:hypothetical protein